MPIWIALVLGVVEGLTEYLPVSSTGHLVLAGHLLQLPDNDPARQSFEIVIQLGAILAVVVHYRSLLADKLKGMLSGDPLALQLLSSLAVAFAPAACVGLAVGHKIKDRLLVPIPVAGALVLGGIVMIVLERSRRSDTGEDGLDKVTFRRALAIGIGQIFSLWPGVSRAMSTIVAGELSGLSASTAAEFSFLLALPTLGAATLFEAYKSRHELASGVGAGSMTIGLLVSFLVAWGVIGTFLRYLRAKGLEVFGWYRVALGIAVLAAARAGLWV
jgi:undecaprenyl-diphosphatase